MQAFVAHLPGNGAGEADGQRLSRLAARGWHLTELPHGIQVATTEATQVVPFDRGFLVGCAWLFNGAELEGDAPSDLARLARLWQSEGPTFTEHLAGAFSVLIVETDAPRCHLVRDHFGMMPAYYSTPNGVTYGSDLRAVLHLSGQDLTPQTRRIADYIVGTESDPTSTAFEGLMRLPAAHSAEVELAKGVVTPKRYWSIPQPPFVTKDAAPGFRSHFEAACAACVDQTEGLGAMLSGGLDSSSLVAVIAKGRAERGAKPVPTLSFVYDGKPYDERDYISEIDRHCHTDPHRISISDAPDLGQMPQMVEEQMDLFLAYGLQKSRAIYDAGHALGLTHLVDGHGGDEVISHGYARLIELAAGRRWMRLVIEAYGASKVHNTGFGDLCFLLAARYGGFAERSIIRRVLMKLAYLLHKRDESRSDFTAKDLLRDAVRPTDVPEAEMPTSFERYEQDQHRKTLQAPLMEHAFEVLHRAAAAAEVTPIYPFYDRRLVHYCLSLPAEAKLRNGATRWALREGLRGILPDKIRKRQTKANFGDEFESTVRAYLDQNQDLSGLDAFVDADAVARLRARLQENRTGQTEPLRAYWRLVVLRDWSAALARWQTLQRDGALM